MLGKEARERVNDPLNKKGMVYIRDSQLAKDATNIHNQKASKGTKYHIGDFYTGHDSSYFHHYQKTTAEILGIKNNSTGHLKDF